jgi:hypothetical protein
MRNGKAARAKDKGHNLDVLVHFPQFSKPIEYEHTTSGIFERGKTRLQSWSLCSGQQDACYHETKVLPYPEVLKLRKETEQLDAL